MTSLVNPNVATQPTQLYEEIMTIMDTLVNVIKQEAITLNRIACTVSKDYVRAVEMIMKTSGKVVITGMGKSGLIARKIAATMTSTGTYATYMHPADAAHGDLGLLKHNDIVIMLSKSGESDELSAILPTIKDMGILTIAITAKEDSTLGKQCDITLHSDVGKEACPYDLAPTSSTTAALAIGDAIAIALMQERRFKRQDFKMYHPGGALGKRA